MTSGLCMSHTQVLDLLDVDDVMAYEYFELCPVIVLTCGKKLLFILTFTLR